MQIDRGHVCAEYSNGAHRLRVQPLQSRRPAFDSFNFNSSSRQSPQDQSGNHKNQQVSVTQNLNDDPFTDQRAKCGRPGLPGIRQRMARRINQRISISGRPHQPVGSQRKSFDRLHRSLPHSTGTA